MSETKMTLANANVFSECISTINKLVAETTIKLLPTHLEITALDPANVALVSFKMDAKEFVEYQVSEEKSFAIKVSDLKNILGRGKGMPLTLFLENNLRLVMNGGVRKEFTLPLIDLDKDQKIPELKFYTETTMDSNELRDAVADVAIVSDACEFKIDASRLIISASGELSKAVSETKGHTRIIEDNPTGGKYSIEYLDKMLGTKLSKNLKVYLGKDYPVKIEYVEGGISMIFILAPRIGND